MTDQELVARWQTGDMIAFGTLYDRYQNELFRTACFLTGNRNDAEDLVQQAFLTTAEYIQKLKDGSKIRSFLLKTLTRAAWRQSGKRKREMPVDSIFETTQQQNSALDALMQNENNRALVKAIETLDEKRKTVIILYYFNELSIAQIAEVTGSFEGTVKSRLHSARQQLKFELKETPLKGEQIHHA